MANEINTATAEITTSESRPSSTSRQMALGVPGLTPERKRELITECNAGLAADSVFEQLPVERFPTVQEVAAQIAKFDGPTTMNVDALDDFFGNDGDRADDGFMRAP